CAVQFPGRYERISEAMLGSVEELVSALVPALLPFLDRPFAMFGHCIGAIVMFEVIRELRARHGLRPVHLFASGAPAPRYYLLPPVPGSRDRFTALLRFLGFTK